MANIPGLMPDGTLSFPTLATDADRIAAIVTLQTIVELHGQSIEKEERPVLDAALAVYAQREGPVPLEDVLERVEHKRPGLAKLIRRNVLDEAELLVHPYLARPTEKTTADWEPRTERGSDERVLTHLCALPIACVAAVCMIVALMFAMTSLSWMLGAVSLLALVGHFASKPRVVRDWVVRRVPPAKLDKQRAAAKKNRDWTATIVAGFPELRLPDGFHVERIVALGLEYQGVVDVHLAGKNGEFTSYHRERVIIGEWFLEQPDDEALLGVVRLVTEDVEKAVAKMRRDLMVVC